MFCRGTPEPPVTTSNWRTKLVITGKKRRNSSLSLATTRNRHRGDWVHFPLPARRSKRTSPNL